jgi:hypothetical protein
MKDKLIEIYGGPVSAPPVARKVKPKVVAKVMCNQRPSRRAQMATSGAIWAGYLEISYHH